MRHFFACLAVLGLAGTAAACINDVELPSHEREFRSQYQNPSNVITNISDDETESAPDYRPWIGGGAILLTSALAFTWFVRRSRS